MTTFPDEPAGEFPAPPHTVTDREERAISIERADESAAADLLEMYLAFDSSDRAQGIPPVTESSIERWLDSVLGGDTYNVVARHDGSPVGHAMLVPDRQGHYELAIFVLGAYQGAGIGTDLLETLLGLGQQEGVEEVWLTVERWNDPAIALYRKVGFEGTDGERFEREMAIRL